MIGVKYAFSNDPSGYGSAARQFITALFVQGVNLTLEPIKQMVESSSYGLPESICKPLINRNIPYSIKIIHLTPDIYPDYMEKGKYNIGHLFWETSHLPKEWIEPCNKMDEIWCASEQMVAMIKKSGVTTRCYAFPQPIDVTKSLETIKPFQTEQERGFTFYSIFQWILRKNPRTLLRAYWQEFMDDDNVTLLLKTYRITYLDKELQLIKEDINAWRKELNQKHYPKLMLVHKVLSDDEMFRLHKMGDVFINPSSGEGWNRPLQEAMLLGNPSISGDNGGITDIMTPNLYYKVESTEKKVEQQPFIPWYTPDMTWKEIDEEDLRRQMRSTFEHKATRKQTAKLAQDFVVSHFSYQDVGASMGKRLLAIEKLIH